MSPWSPDDAHRLCHELDAVLEQQRLTILFQPIASLRGRSVLGYEALVRGPADSALHNPLVLFSAAERCQRLAELDRLCQRLATARFLAMGLPGLLFLNMVPSLLLENDDHAERLIGQLGASGLPPQRVVLELSERYPLEDAQGLRRALEPYSQAGHAIAIDDLGAGYASLRLWSQLRPAYVKVDQHFVRGLDDDPVKREFVRSMGEIARGVGAQLVAEGVETAGELNVLAELGIELALAARTDGGRAGAPESDHHAGYQHGRGGSLVPSAAGSEHPAGGYRRSGGRRRAAHPVQRHLPQPLRA
jgi:EAL domain-containing protein (putative c-di-GMP-specific phosphodiesterase class I)